MTRLGIAKKDFERARQSIELNRLVKSQIGKLVDSSDLIRFSYVQTVAAMDQYIHGIVYDRAVNIVLGRYNSQTRGARTNIGLTFHDIQMINSAGSETERINLSRSIVADRLHKETFQSVGGIENVLRIFGIIGIWPTVFPSYTEDNKKRLNEIVHRRNLIAHQCDRDPLDPDQVLPIDISTAEDSINFIENFLVELDKII
ncbi:hypothetical protein LBW78_00505 [Rothia kristinae]|uniref:HEPN domain-containing protein n=1 Tax=Rothia kristinae TaxID=37923 RepID=UPI001CD2A6BF|nr:HEPN domain-containing protein [Rothia kristinae]MCA1168895.1 hypothetical protein [Rothia kristinae]